MALPGLTEFYQIDSEILDQDVNIQACMYIAAWFTGDVAMERQKLDYMSFNERVISRWTTYNKCVICPDLARKIPCGISVCSSEFAWFP